MSTREWMDPNVVGIRKMATDVGVLQRQIREFGEDVHLHLIHECYCYVFFSNADSMQSFL